MLAFALILGLQPCDFVQSHGPTVFIRVTRSSVWSEYDSPTSPSLSVSPMGTCAVAAGDEGTQVYRSAHQRAAKYGSAFVGWNGESPMFDTEAHLARDVFRFADRTLRMTNQDTLEFRRTGHPPCLLRLSSGGAITYRGGRFAVVEVETGTWIWDVETGRTHSVPATTSSAVLGDEGGVYYSTFAPALSRGPWIRGTTTVHLYDGKHRRICKTRGMFEIGRVTESAFWGVRRDHEVAGGPSVRVNKRGAQTEIAPGVAERWLPAGRVEVPLY